MNSSQILNLFLWDLRFIFWDLTRYIFCSAGFSFSLRLSRFLLGSQVDEFLQFHYRVCDKGQWEFLLYPYYDKGQWEFLLYPYYDNGQWEFPLYPYYDNGQWEFPFLSRDCDRYLRESYNGTRAPLSAGGASWRGGVCVDGYKVSEGVFVRYMPKCWNRTERASRARYPIQRPRAILTGLEGITFIYFIRCDSPNTDLGWSNTGSNRPYYSLY